MNGDVAFYANLLDDMAVLSRVDTPEKCQELIDAMENDCPHDLLPRHYDLIVARRNLLNGRDE